MLGLLLIVLLLLGMRFCLQNHPVVLINMIAICAALCNQFVQDWLPGTQGLSLSIVIAGVVVVFVADNDKIIKGVKL